MPSRVFFVNDIQDVWLFNVLIGAGDLIVYNSTNKLTSPHNYAEFFAGMGCKTYQYLGMDDPGFQSIMGSCKLFITKECLPFKTQNEFKDKTVSISWVGESSAESAVQYEIKDCYNLHFCEPLFVPIYNKLGITGADPRIPKYYFLNQMTRKMACKVLGIDPNKGYVTVFSNNFFNHKFGTGGVDSKLQSMYDECGKKIFDEILSVSKRNGLEIILKNKMKHGSFMKGDLEHNHFMSGNDVMFHQGLLLLAVSEFSVGFGSSCAAEAKTMDAPYINFWSNDVGMGNSAIVCDEHIVKGAAYKLPEESNNFLNIYRKTPSKDASIFFDRFSRNKSRYDFGSKFEVHPIFKRSVHEV